MRAVALLLAIAAASARGAVVAPDTAAAEAFAGATVTRASWALTDAEMTRVEELAGTRPASRLVAGFVAKTPQGSAGTALLDGHVVRTKPELLLVAIAPDLTVKRVDVLSFEEPSDYAAPPAFLRQFEGKPLGDDLRLRRGLRAVTGASLTSRAQSDAVRRALAITRVLAERLK